MPSTHFSRNTVAVLVSSATDCSRLRAISGMRTFSSKLPCVPATVIAVSLPITWAPTCMTTSGMTGLTLPGMIEEPFWSSGRKISPRPQRGPEPIHARSLAIFVSDTATILRAADASTRPSRLAWASNGSAGAEIFSPVSDAMMSRTIFANFLWVLSPVPVAVPPSGIMPRRGSVAFTRCVPRRTCAAYPANSWPRVTGTASMRCVRPAFTRPPNSLAFAAKDFSSASRAGMSLWLISSRAAR